MCLPCTNRALTALVQVARAVVPSEDVVQAGVEAQLIPWLQPEFVFVQTPDMLLVWGEEKAMEEWGGALVAVLPRVQPAHVEAALRDARELGGGGAAPPPADPAAYGTHAPLTLTGDGDGTVVRYALISTDPALSRGQQKGLDYFRSRRGVAKDRRVVALRVQPDGTASLLAANCDASFGELSTVAAAAAAAPARAVLSAAGSAALAALVGEGAQCRLQPGQAAEKQVLSFAPDEAASEPVQPPLIADRPWGLQLLLLMAAGHKDRTLHVALPDADTLGAGEGALQGIDASLPVAMSVGEGLDWRLYGMGQGDDDDEVVSMGQRALLPRHALLKVALPTTDEARELWAVGSSRMLLGAGQGSRSLVAVGGVTLLPPGGEFLAARTRTRTRTRRVPGLRASRQGRRRRGGAPLGGLAATEPCAAHLPPRRRGACRCRPAWPPAAPGRGGHGGAARLARPVAGGRASGGDRGVPYLLRPPRGAFAASRQRCVRHLPASFSRVVHLPLVLVAV